MRDLLIPLVALLAVAFLVALFLALLALRRTLLTRPLGSFECSVRHESVQDGGEWTAGVARYGRDGLEWFRFFAFSFHPAEVLDRGRLLILEQREAEDGESYSVLPDWVVVRCGYGPEIVELAMTEGNYNGLAAWVESAPPGQQVNVA